LAIKWMGIGEIFLAAARTENIELSKSSGVANIYSFILPLGG